MTPPRRHSSALAASAVWACQTLATVTACATSVALASLYLGQRKLVWVGQRANGDMFAAADPAPPKSELIRLSAEHVGCFFPAEGAMAPEKIMTVVYFHGNGDQLGWGSVFLGPQFAASGLNFFGVEYPGYGVADGDVSENSVLGATNSLLTHLEKARGISRSSMVLVGQSIGCFPAIEMSRRGFGSRLVLLTPFSNLQDMAGEAFPFLRPLLAAFPFFLRDKLDNAKVVPSITTPTLIVHGTLDEVVPFEQGKLLSTMFPEGVCSFESVEGAGHNNLFEGSRLPSIMRLIRNFSETGQIGCSCESCVRA